MRRLAGLGALLGWAGLAATQAQNVQCNNILILVRLIHKGWRQAWLLTRAEMRSLGLPFHPDPCVCASQVVGNGGTAANSFNKFLSVRVQERTRTGALVNQLVLRDTPSTGQAACVLGISQTGQADSWNFDGDGLPSVRNKRSLPRKTLV